MLKNILLFKRAVRKISDAIAADVGKAGTSQKNAAEEFKALSGAAREAGVNDKDVRLFMILPDIKECMAAWDAMLLKNLKKIPEKRKKKKICMD